MGRYRMDRIKDGGKTYYIIRHTDDMSLVIAPTKYLKHKTKSNRSPNTVRRIAFSLTVYLSFLEENHLTVGDVLEMKYDHGEVRKVWVTEEVMWKKRKMQPRNSYGIRKEQSATV